MHTLLQDLRDGVRTFFRSPGFSAVTVMTLGLGIGAATAIFSVVHGVLLQALPYPQPDRLVRVLQVSAQGQRMNFSDPNFEEVREQSRALAGMAQFSSGTVSVAGGREPARALVTWVSRDFFSVIGVQPSIGRAFTEDEMREGGAPAVIVSHGFWQRLLGGPMDVTSRTLTVQDRVTAIVGVMPPGFQFPAGADLWAARELLPRLPSRTAHNWQVVARLGDGVTLARAQDDVSRIARRLQEQHGDDTWMADAALVPLQEHLVGRVRPALLALLGAAACLLLITCANAFNLMLARMAARRRELAVRRALGAGGLRLARQLFAESMLLAVAGGLLGVLLASWGIAALVALEPGNLPRLHEIGLHGQVLGFAFGVSLAIALGLGAVAVLRATSGELRSTLADVRAAGEGGLQGHRLRGALVVGQFALTLVLLVAAGLLARTVLRLMAVDPGFRVTGGVTMNLALRPAQDETERPRLAQFHDTLLSRLRAVPGIDAVGGVNDFPLGGSYSSGTFLVLGHPGEVGNWDDWARLSRVAERAGHAEYRVASDGYFEAMEIPLLRGRAFDDRDAPGAAHAAVVSESLARTRWPGEDPLGRLVHFGNMDGDLRPLTVVGVVGDIRERGIDAEPQPTIYAFHRQRPAAAARFHVVMHGSAEPGAMMRAARAVVHDLDPTLPPRFRTLDEVVAGSLAERRFSLALIAVFGAAALLLAVVGIYGVTSYIVAQRTREIGIRMALGAQRDDVMGLVFRYAIGLALGGVLLGAAAAYGATRFVEHLLYEVSATDPVTFAAVIALLLGVAVMASYLPARRAMRVDPMVALRAE